MLKALLLLALATTAYCQLLGGLYGQPVITEEVIETAEWCTEELTTTYNHEGEHHIANIRDYSTQIVAGTIERFTVDYIVVQDDNTYSVSEFSPKIS